MKKNNTQSLYQDYSFELECLLREYTKFLLKERLKEEGVPISTETLDRVSDDYSEELLRTVEICMSNLIETDVSNLKNIFEQVRKRKD